MIDESLIWDLSNAPDRKRLEFTNIIRFKDQWFCTFREADLHNSHPSSRLRVLRSSDWKTWESAAVLDWDCADLRDPQLSITAEGFLMINSSIVFGEMKLRSEAEKLGPGAVPREVENEIDYSKPVFVRNDAGGWQLDPVEADGVMRQSVTWLSKDGSDWSSAHCCPTGVNVWRWSVTWHNGMGYSLARARPSLPGGRGQLFRTRDGKNWRLLKEDVFPEGERCNEACIAFESNHTAWAIVRQHPIFAVLGRSEGPHYQDWQWAQLKVRTLAEPDKLYPAEEKLGVQMGGPKMKSLSDGRIIAMGRTDAGGVRNEISEAGGPARIGLFHVDTENNVLNEWAEIDARSYPCMAEHDGVLHMTYGKGNAKEIWAGRMEIPSK